ncbi:MAG: methyl-accepting chemotaxis protein [Clostridia bacterium]|jgi:methyl-accepting chemotaxis protein|nr:methyl-accepting chemotaxis protein [Clostridia bacterium]
MSGSDATILENTRNALQIFHRIMNGEIGVGLADREKFLFYLPAKDLDLHAKLNQPLTPGTGIYRVIHEELPQLIMRVDKKVHGIPYVTRSGAIYNDEGGVIGSIAITQSMQRYETIKETSATLLDNITLLASNSEQITAQTEEIAGITQGLAKIAEGSQSRVNESNLALELIQTIAGQTNLLGLNAAIEAARVGELGRGFGVVAGEIRKLASDSAESIAKIKAIIIGIQNDSNTTYQQIKQVEEGINQVTEAISQMVAATQEIHAKAAVLDEEAEKY